MIASLSASLTLAKTLPPFGKGGGAAICDFVYCKTQVNIDAHYFARRFHFQPERNIQALVAQKWKHRFFHRKMFRHDFFRESEFA